jgi:hypothetical protein
MVQPVEESFACLVKVNPVSYPILSYACESADATYCCAPRCHRNCHLAESGSGRNYRAGSLLVVHWVYGIIGGVRPRILEALIEAERLAWGRWQPGLLFHLTRSAPLREEPGETWRKLQREYDALVMRESGKYPIRVLSNDGELEETVSKAIAEFHEE